MDSTEFRRLIARANLTIRGAARFFRSNPRRARDWADGVEDIPRAVQAALVSMEMAGVSADDIAGRLGWIEDGGSREERSSSTER